MTYLPPLAIITTPRTKRPVLLLGFTADEVTALALRWNGVAAHDTTWTPDDSERWERLSGWTPAKSESTKGTSE